MAKKSRKTKAKKSDFQKVKLKVGKKKPRASNATETAFKSQSIYIPEQLKNVSLRKAVDESQLSQKTNVEDLLVQVGHYNPNSRTDALSGLKVHLANNRHLIPIHLPKIIEKISKLIIDADAQVRKSCTALFKLLFTSLTSKQISPFFDVIVSHLHCAMTHIYEDVQRDSLQVVDLCIEHFPDLLSKDNQNLLLHHFIELISTRRSSTGTKSNTCGNAGDSRVLSMRLSKKESSVSWRIKVLSRLHVLLKASYNAGQKQPSRVFHEVLSHKLGNENYELHSSSGIVLSSNSTCVGDILSSYNNDLLRRNHISLRRNSLNVMESLNSVNSSKLTPWQQMTTLIPLLFDSWVEASVDKKTLDVETVQTMSSVLNIIVLLCKEFISSSDNATDAITKIRAEYMKDFKTHFVASFPFYHHEPEKHQQRKKRAKKQCDDIQTLLEEIQNCNLLICELVTLLAMEKELRTDSDSLSSVAMFISSLLIPDGSRRKVQITSISMQQVIRSTKQLLDISADQSTTGNLLRPLLLFSQKLSGNHPLKTQILKFFLDLHSSQRKLKFGLHCNPVMVEWLCSLPGYLVFILHSKSKLEMEGKCRNHADNGPLDATTLVLSCMRLASLQNNKEYLKSLEMKLEIILSVFTSASLFCDPQTNVNDKLVYCEHCSSLQARIFEIVVCFSIGLTDKHMKQLSHICHLLAVSPQNVYYLTEMLVWRAAPERSLISRDEYPQHMLFLYKFICSVIIGLSKDELISLGDSIEGVTISCQILDIMAESSIAFERHHQLLTVMRKFFSFVDHLSQMFQELVCDKLLALCKLPAKSVLGIMISCNEILKLDHLSSKQSSDLTAGLSRLCVDCLLACNETESFSKNEYIVRTLEKYAFNLLGRDSMMDEFLQYYGSKDFSTLSVVESSLLVLEKIVINSELNKKFISCKSSVEQMFQSLKNHDNGICKNPRFIFLTEALK